MLVLVLSFLAVDVTALKWIHLAAMPVYNLLQGLAWVEDFNILER
jgi:hypothetical protein